MAPHGYVPGSATDITVK